MMPLHILTIVLDGMPFLPMQLACFNRLRCDWTWHIVEGAARNVNCTAWCKTQYPRLSLDGSHEFIEGLRNHPRVHVRWQPDWKGGKVEMVNAAIEHIDAPCILLEVDVDELWQHWQIERLVQQFEMFPNATCARVKMQYHVGLNIVTVGENCYGNNPGEWLRAWRFHPGQRFAKHEPPVLFPDGERSCLDTERTSAYDIIPQHWAYVFESQVAYKEQFYGYDNAVAHWRKLQENTIWPVKRLKDFLPWVDGRVGADLLHKPEPPKTEAGFQTAGPGIHIIPRPRCKGDGQP